MLRYSIIFLFLLNSVLVFSQDSIVYFDRPGVGDGPYIVQKGKINIESGSAYSPYFGKESAYLPGILSRFHLTSKSELRLMYNYSPQSLNFLIESFYGNYNHASVGFKRKLARTPKRFADVALISNVYYPINELGNFEMSNIRSDVYLVFEHNHSNGSYINYSLGYIYGGKFIKDMLQWSFAGNLYVRKVLFFAEYFGYYNIYNSYKDVEFGFDTGIVYEFNGNMQLDFSIIYNKFGAENALTYALGYSICIQQPHLKQK